MLEYKCPGIYFNITPRFNTQTGESLVYAQCPKDPLLILIEIHFTLNGRCFAIQGVSMPVRFSLLTKSAPFCQSLVSFSSELHKGFILKRVIKLLSSQFIWPLRNP